MVPAATFSALEPVEAWAASEPNATTIWHRQPAVKWEEALAVGNGRLGAMIFGGTEKERLQLNEITVWSGWLEQNADKPKAYKSLPAIRQLIADGKYADAGKMISAERLCLKGGRFGRDSYGSYQTLGDLNFGFAPMPEPVTNYRRLAGYRLRINRRYMAIGRRYLDSRDLLFGYRPRMVRKLDLHADAIFRHCGSAVAIMGLEYGWEGRISVLERRRELQREKHLRGQPGFLRYGVVGESAF